MTEQFDDKKIITNSQPAGRIPVYFPSQPTIGASNLMKCITIMQPFPYLILRPDITDAAARDQAAAQGYFKDIENRTWTTKYRGPLLIHSSKRPHPDIDLYREAMEEFGIIIPLTRDLVYGQVVGQVTLSDVVDDCESFWFTGPYGLLLKDPMPFPVTTKATGKLGLWEYQMSK